MVPFYLKIKENQFRSGLVHFNQASFAQFGQTNLVQFDSFLVSSFGYLFRFQIRFRGFCYRFLYEDLYYYPKVHVLFFISFIMDLYTRIYVSKPEVFGFVVCGFVLALKLFVCLVLREFLILSQNH